MQICYIQYCNHCSVFPRHFVHLIEKALQPNFPELSLQRNSKEFDKINFSFQKCVRIDEFTLLNASWVIRARWREIQRFVRKFNFGFFIF